MDVNKGKSAKKEDIEESINKKEASSDRKVVPKNRPISNTKQKILYFVLHPKISILLQKK